MVLQEVGQQEATEAAGLSFQKRQPGVYDR